MSYEQSMRIHEESGGETVSPSTLNNIGAVYWNLGEYHRAMDFFKRSLEITERIGDLKTNAACLNNCGLIHWGFCEYKKALEYFMRSLEIAERIGSRKSEAANLNNIGKAYVFFCEYGESLEYLTRSLAITRECYMNASEIAIEIGSIDHKKGIDLSILSLDLSEDKLAGIEKGINELFSSIEDPVGVNLKAALYRLPGRLYSKRREWSRATESFEKALAIFKDLDDSYELAITHYNRGQMLRESGDEAGSKKSISKAGKIFTRIGAKGWLDQINIWEQM